MSLAGETASAAMSDPPAKGGAAKVKVYPGDAFLPFRQPLRKVFDNIKTEFIVTALVLINMLGLLIDMAVTDGETRLSENASAAASTLRRPCAPMRFPGGRLIFRKDVSIFVIVYQ